MQRLSKRAMCGIIFKMLIVNSQRLMHSYIEFFNMGHITDLWMRWGYRDFDDIFSVERECKILTDSLNSQISGLKRWCKFGKHPHRNGRISTFHTARVMVAIKRLDRSSRKMASHILVVVCRTQGQLKDILFKKLIKLPRILDFKGRVTKRIASGRNNSLFIICELGELHISISTYLTDKTLIIFY